jgi:hypothetical protein
MITNLIFLALCEGGVWYPIDSHWMLYGLMSLFDGLSHRFIFSFDSM